MAANGVVQKVGIVGLIALIPTVWLVGGSAINWVDERIVDVCSDEVTELKEEIGNLRGQLGQLWMEMCDLTPGKRWYRGGCIIDEGR